MEIIAILEALQTDFSFDSAEHVYRDKRGRRVSWAAVRSLLLQVTRSAEAEMVALSRSLVSGDTDLASWQREMLFRIKTLHLISKAVAHGGFQQLAPADYGQVGGILAREYRFLQRFATQIEEGAPLDGRVIQRTRLYARATSNTYFLAMRDAFRKKGFDEERSRLRPAEHCEQCVGEEEKSWQGLGDMVPIGARTCLRNCRCVFEFRNSRTSEVAGPF